MAAFHEPGRILELDSISTAGGGVVDFPRHTLTKTLGIFESTCNVPASRSVLKCQCSSRALDVCPFLLTVSITYGLL